VVLETYGAGNGPDSRQDLMDEMRIASERGVIFVNCTQCLYGSVVPSYATGKVIKQVVKLICQSINFIFGTIQTLIRSRAQAC
jgi:L-asparaginase/Glu-tRNA(Gln) amidotransferase subunit D